MGYTHYWRQDKNIPFTDDEWDKITEATKVILSEAEKENIPLGNWEGNDEPEVTDSFISLNGVGEDSHETFRLQKQEQPSPWEPEDTVETFACCKTGYSPYDKVVVSILAKAKEIAPDKINISSDGGDEALVYQF